MREKLENVAMQVFGSYALLVLSVILLVVLLIP